jgi:hypothetical protein
MKRLVFVIALLAAAAPLWSAKVIMKDGKIYEGRIIDDSDGDILIKTKTHWRPKLLPGNDILSVTRDAPEVVVRDPQRYTIFESLIAGHVSMSEGIEMDPSASLRLGGGMRPHPVVEVGAGLEWKPSFGGELSMSDGTTTRNYESFKSWNGGFSAKIYPFYQWKWAIEPFLVGGYEWSRLMPAGTDEALKGGGYKVGLGTSWPIKGNWYLEGQLVFRDIEYRRVFFLDREGTLNPSVHARTLAFATGVSYRF